MGGKIVKQGKEKMSGRKMCTAGRSWNCGAERDRGGRVNFSKGNK